MSHALRCEGEKMSAVCICMCRRAAGDTCTALSGKAERLSRVQTSLVAYSPRRPCRSAERRAD